MGYDDLEGLVGLFCRRYDLIDALADGPRSKNELESDLDVSRSTVDRAVRSLEAEGILVREGGSVSLTFLGRVTLKGYQQLREGLVGLHRAKSMFAPVDTEEMVPFELFRGADVVTADPKAPHRPVAALAQFLDDMSEVQSVVKGLMADYVRMYHTQIVENRLDAELVVESSVLDDLIATYWDPVSDALSSDRLVVYETSSEPPYSVKIGESDTTEVAVITYGEQGVSGFLRSDNDRAVSWARRVYERTKSEASLVAPMD
ncbi:helix-turn-helix transcriptional regulator [Halanaeroarchaeum sulfurireducens]|uniref:MarR family transcriptional regulator n=1 Tax=Halanaeroarchaeum sulfurireducens TaxID=1604004 RepID=A0A0F7PC31_9EURY|nr:HTH domain-containing protein [Halanaeroarchaeum sulfurireducens]AKH97705.1 MarR family transcriptional regulator [Halanaeroarchaeum sulfurireducens]ALG82100.1 MarR family transcriptional regulator [Halanaeroarchaeum sulfurireducens]